VVGGAYLGSGRARLHAEHGVVGRPPLLPPAHRRVVLERKKDEPLDRATQLVGRIVDGGDGDWERATRDCGGGGAKMYIYRVQRRRAAKYLPGVDVRECRESRDTREPSTKEKNIWRREHSRTGWMRALSRGRADILRAAGPVLWLWLGLLLARTRTRIPRTERE
jgi:hypothetical protein